MIDGDCSGHDDDEKGKTLMIKLKCKMRFMSMIIADCFVVVRTQQIIHVCDTR